VTGELGNTFSTPRDIAAHFVTQLGRKYQPITVEETAVAALQNSIHPVGQTTYTEQLQQPISNDELLVALRAGARRKSPGIDGLSLEFYTENWETVSLDLLLHLNHMFLDKHISRRQKHRIILCLPKNASLRYFYHYRPISLLTTECKLLARIYARRLRQILADQLQNNHFGGVPGKPIQDAISYTRDVIAHAEATGTPMCVLSLDFQQAFHRIAHQYLFHILKRYGITPWFVERIRALYDQATASLRINGSLAGNIPIQRGVRKGCPLSVTLYALCLHPLIRALEDNLSGIKIGRHTEHGPVIAYADDVTVFVTNPGDFQAIQQAIHLYERATGARLNPRKLLGARRNFQSATGNPSKA
jgi:hypothetical protein